MERPRINYIPKGLSVDYEEEYSKYLMQEVSFEPRDNDNFMALLRLLERRLCTHAKLLIGAVEHSFLL